MIKPKGDYILVKIIKDDNGGVVLSGKQESQKGQVVMCGEGEIHYVHGTSTDPRTEMNLQKGDVIVWQRFADADYTFDEGGETYTLVKIQQVMGVEV